MGVSEHEELFLRSLDFGQKNALNFGKDLLFWGGWDHLVFTEQLPQPNSRLMKIRVKFVYG